MTFLEEHFSFSSAGHPQYSENTRNSTITGKAVHLARMKKIYSQRIYFILSVLLLLQEVRLDPSVYPKKGLSYGKEESHERRKRSESSNVKDEEKSLLPHAHRRHRRKHKFILWSKQTFELT